MMLMFKVTVVAKLYDFYVKLVCMTILRIPEFYSKCTN